MWALACALHPPAQVGRAHRPRRSWRPYVRCGCAECGARAAHHGPQDVSVSTPPVQPPLSTAAHQGLSVWGWWSRRGGRVGERAGVVNVDVEVEVGEAVAVRQTSG